MDKIVLGVSGSIAAYKSLSLVRLLIKAGKEVKVVMTHAATEFVAPLSFSTLSKNDVFIDVVSEESWNNHVDLGLWADVMIIAPATANTLSKMASGQADNMLVATYLSAKCPVLFAPAMDLDMWKHPSTQKNVQTLQSYGNFLIPVAHGELASGLVGDGRMAEPEHIFDLLERHSKKKDLTGKKILITAGPTRESIDPVRFISNHSSGRMGIALAEECKSRGAKVELILGPSNIKVYEEGISITEVVSATDMYTAAKATWPSCDIGIFAAAVADYTPINPSENKMKKVKGNLQIELERTQDIALDLGSNKKDGQLTIGFAMETSDEKVNARKKLGKKNFDMIVLNSLREPGAGFQHDTNKVSIFHKSGKENSYGLKSKRDVATDIINELVQTYLSI